MMKIGNDISRDQEQLLARARRAGPLQVEAFFRVADDDDIRNEREDLHADWLDLFEAQRGAIERRTPPELFRRVASFFEEARPVDSTLASINPSDQKITFLLGAGASKPEPSHIPTVKELLPQLLERARRLDRDDVNRLADYCDERKIDNIEDLLTAAQLATFCSRAPTVLRLMNFLLYRRDAEEPNEFMYYEEHFGPVGMRRPEVAADVSSVAFLQDTLQVLFGLLASTMLPARPNDCHRAIVDYASSDRGTAIVTTNYDCLIDMALEEGQRSLDYRIAFANIPESEGEGPAREVLIKLHGSLNWYYCETCQEVQRVDIAQMTEHYMKDASPYPVIGICKQCGGQRRGLLVPPLAMKFDVAPPLTPLQQEAQEAFERADVIVVVGYSFAEADTYISRMLSKSMQTRLEQRLVVVDPDARIVSRLRRKFKASIPGFDNARIVRAAEDCVKFMPGFLRGERYSEEEARRSGGRQTRKARHRD